MRGDNRGEFDGGTKERAAQLIISGYCVSDPCIHLEPAKNFKFKHGISAHLPHGCILQDLIPFGLRCNLDIS